MEQKDLELFNVRQLESAELEEIEGGLLAFVVAGALLGYFIAKMIDDKQSA